MTSSVVCTGRLGRLVAFASLAALALCPSSAAGLNFTLSDPALMAFDTVYTSQNAALLRKTDVPGPGVELEIQLTSNAFQFFYGTPLNEGVLSRADYQQFDNFNLKFSYVGVAGGLPAVTNAGLVGAGCSVGGSYVNPWIAPVTKPTNIASIRTNAAGGSEQWIGLDVTSWAPQYFNPSGAIVTIRVEADPSAVIIPEPNCLAILSLGGLTMLMMIRCRLRHQQQA